MTTIPEARSIKHGLPYNAVSTKSSCTTETMTTNIDHIMKEKLEQIWKLPDVIDVVEDADQIFNVNNTEDETEDETNNESDDENTTTQT